VRLRPGGDDVSALPVGAPLSSAYDLIAFDLDGVLHRGDEVVARAPDVVDAVRAAGHQVLFLTNNAARTPEQVASRLVRLGIAARPDEIMTSALATGAMLGAEGSAGSSAFVIGEDGIRSALISAGIAVVDGEPDRTDMVVVGWDRHADYGKLRRACLLVERGARLIATNADRSFPAPDGLWPGAGALLAVITTTTAAAATVVGKPGRPMFDAAVRRTGAERPLIVGDRLDTDIAGAVGAAWDSLLVLSGVSRAGDLPGPWPLPTYVAAEVGAVIEPRVRATLRAAEPDDAAGVAALLAAGGVDATAGASGIIGEENGSTVVAVRGVPGEVLATAAITRRAAGIVLQAVMVRPDVRRQGLGLLTVAAALKLGDPRRPALVFAGRDQSFFAMLGFEPLAPAAAPRDIAALLDEQGCAATGAPMMRRPTGG
jgi:glycerol-1-phosphatase